MDKISKHGKMEFNYTEIEIIVKALNLAYIKYMEYTKLSKKENVEVLSRKFIDQANACMDLLDKIECMR